MNFTVCINFDYRWVVHKHFSIKIELDSIIAIIIEAREQNFIVTKY